MTGFFYMHFGDDVPKNIEKEYNRLLLHEQYLEKKEQKYRIQTATFEDVITVCPDPAGTHKRPDSYDQYRYS
jgi:hypothetical protein